MGLEWGCIQMGKWFLRVPSVYPMMRTTRGKDIFVNEVQGPSLLHV